MCNTLLPECAELFATGRILAQSSFFDVVSLDHLVVGMLDLNTSTAHSLLLQLDIDCIEKVRRRIARGWVMMQYDEYIKDPGPGTVPSDRKVETVFKQANKEADALLHPTLDTRHILLGMLRHFPNERGISSLRLRGGITYSQVKEHVKRQGSLMC